MTRVHDMGGRFGDTSITPEAETVKFHADWHPRALALTLACGTLGLWNIDTSRHARESLRPGDYARFTYYEKWIAALADLLVATHALSLQDLTDGHATDRSPLAQKCLTPEAVGPTLAKGGPATRPGGPAAAFAPGDRARLRKFPENLHIAGGHTRLPAYLAGATGTILRHHGTHVLPDSNAHGLGEAPEPLYAVAFRAADLWAHPEHPGDEVVADLWQSYLSRA